MEYVEGKVGVEENDEDTHQGGGIAAGVYIFLQICCSVGAALWRGDIGRYPPPGPGTG